MLTVIKCIDLYERDCCVSRLFSPEQHTCSSALLYMGETSHCSVWTQATSLSSMTRETRSVRRAGRSTNLPNTLNSDRVRVSKSTFCTVSTCHEAKLRFSRQTDMSVNVQRQSGPCKSKLPRLCFTVQSLKSRNDNYPTWRCLWLCTMRQFFWILSPLQPYISQIFNDDHFNCVLIAALMFRPERNTVCNVMSARDSCCIEWYEL